jgi:hypothetical protein
LFRALFDEVGGLVVAHFFVYLQIERRVKKDFLVESSVAASRYNLDGGVIAPRVSMGL